MPLPPATLVDRLMGEICKQRKRIVVIGDALTDLWVHGRVEESQDGCPKFVEESRCTTPGGAANAERCLSNWGVNTSLYGWSVSDRPTKCRFVGPDGKIVLRWDDDEVVGRGRSRYDWIYHLGAEMVRSAGAVLLSDYDKGFMSPAFIREIADLCQQRGIPCVADVKRGPEVYEGCLLKFNHDWWESFSSRFDGDELLEVESVLTCGDRSPVINGEERIPSLPPVKCVNHVGAGDCFSAHLALGLAYGFSLKEAAALAHSAGRVYVQFAHNRPPQPSEIAADMATAN